MIATVAAAMDLPWPCAVQNNANARILGRVSRLGPAIINTVNEFQEHLGAPPCTGAQRILKNNAHAREVSHLQPRMALGLKFWTRSRCSALKMSFRPSKEGLS